MKYPSIGPPDRDLLALVVCRLEAGRDGRPGVTAAQTARPRTRPPTRFGSVRGPGPSDAQPGTCPRCGMKLVTTSPSRSPTTWTWGCRLRSTGPARAPDPDVFDPWKGNR